MRTKTLLDIPEDTLRGRRVLVRVDFNVPLDAESQITSDARIREAIPTLRYLTERGARVTLLSHLGRPSGPAPELTLRPVAVRLQELLDAPVEFVPDTVGGEAQTAADAIEDGAVLLLENTRFLSGETSNDPALSEAFARFGDLFVQDAFGAAHRAHASTEGVARVIREQGGEAVAGLLLARELNFLRDALRDPEAPFVAVLGGAKISGKIDVIEALLPRVDRLVIGGAMANTFLRAAGYETGESLVEEDRVELARALLDQAGDRLMLPVDLRVAEDLGAEEDPRAIRRDALGPADRAGDIGPQTEALYRAELLPARTVVWNGPMGIFELGPFSHGTVAMARACADAAESGAMVVVGGGDSASALEEVGLSDQMTHISTGGGAALELLAGTELPGVASLEQIEDPQGEGTR